MRLSLFLMFTLAFVLTLLPQSQQVAAQVPYHTMAGAAGSLFSLTWAPGQYWDARSPDTITSLGNSERTITAWVFLANPDKDQFFWGQNSLSGGCAGGELAIGYSAWHSLGFVATSCDLFQTETQVGAGVPQYQAGWYHVAFTWQPTTSTATVYVNGVASRARVGQLQLASSTGRVVIGARAANSSVLIGAPTSSVPGLVFPWLGQVGAVNVYPYALTPDQINTDANGQTLPGPVTALRPQVQPWGWQGNKPQTN